MKGPYARRTEIKRDEARETAREHRLDIGEVKACNESVEACDKFLESRGLGSGNHTRITLNLVNRIVKQRVQYRRKEQEALPTKSLKAALLREIVMEARRRGAIRMGYEPKQELEAG